MRQPLVIGNWKQNGRREGISSLCGALDAQLAPLLDAGSVSVGVCPVSLHIGEVRDQLDARIQLGAQDTGLEADGAFTGQFNSPMLADLGCELVIVGHSERRSLCGEDDVLVGAKALAALDAGLLPVVCVGETLDERESGAAESVVERQCHAVVQAVGDRLDGIVVAYEPVWAIGTGRSATAEQADAMHAHVRTVLDSARPGAGAVVRVLYGGSVKADNAGEIFARDNIDGGLIGGASLDATAFAAIVAAAANGD